MGDRVLTSGKCAQGRTPTMRPSPRITRLGNAIRTQRVRVVNRSCAWPRAMPDSLRGAGRQVGRSKTVKVGGQIPSLPPVRSSKVLRPSSLGSRPACGQAPPHPAAPSLLQEERAQPISVPRDVRVQCSRSPGHPNMRRRQIASLPDTCCGGDFCRRRRRKARPSFHLMNPNPVDADRLLP